MDGFTKEIPGIQHLQRQPNKNICQKTLLILMENEINGNSIVDFKNAVCLIELSFLISGCFGVIWTMSVALILAE